MQNVFPHLLSWSLLAPFLLRSVAGAYFVMFGWKALTTEWQVRKEFFEANGLPRPEIFATTNGIADLLGGMLLLMGFHTQIVALCLAVVCLIAIISKASGEKFPLPDIHVYVILLVVLSSLFITGAGYYGMDLPL